MTNGAPIPDLPYEVITAENVHRLRQIARCGCPRLLETNPYRLTADGKTIVVGTTLGLEFYDAATQTKTGGFEVEFLCSFDLTPDGAIPAHPGWREPDRLDKRRTEGAGI